MYCNLDKSYFLKNFPSGSSFFIALIAVGAVNKDLTLMVRQLAPTAQGVPIEIYAFAADKKWENYEQIMSDIFDHLLASIAFFELECFEYSYPSNPKK